MAVSRASLVEDNFQQFVRNQLPARHRADRGAAVRAGSSLTGHEALRLFEAQLESRVLDLVARELKNEGQSYYTIGSSGHEGNAAVAAVMSPDDWAFLHYRSGAFWCARASGEPGGALGGRAPEYAGDGAFDVLLGLCASADEPVAGGRHKVFGSLPLHIPPQTSTIASQLPKAVGFAVALDRRARLLSVPESRISVVSFGDASANHAVAVGAIHTARWAAYQNIPVPVLFVCEDNGIGISTHTPTGWVGHTWSNQPNLAYFFGDGLDLPDAYDAARAAVDYVRERRRPAFLHLRTVRLLGHAGSDVEQLYHSEREIAATEQRDPLLATAALVIGAGLVTPEEVLSLYQGIRTRLAALAREAVSRPKITTRAAVMAPLYRHDPEVVRAAVPVGTPQARAEAFGKPPEADERPRHLAWHINRALLDLLLARPEMIIFGEDVAKKGGVYHVTAELTAKVGVGRVFNTLLDETSILGLAIGAGHAGLLPFPEIQYLAYLTNAIDQLRGEAASMQFFSQGQYANPMVVRIAGLAYQKGFGGHFHNDNGVAQIREIPGLLIACPARGDDAARMLRTLAAAAISQGRTCIFLEPIALYMTKDLHRDGDGGWLARYPQPSASLPIGEIGIYDEGDADGPPELVIATYANGLWMSLRVARRSGRRIRVVDLRWLLPLPHDALEAEVRATGRLLVVDECRRHSGIADEVAAEMGRRVPDAVIEAITAPDTYIPLAAAANLVLVQEDEIAAAIEAMLPPARTPFREVHP